MKYISVFIIALLFGFSGYSQTPQKVALEKKKVTIKWMTMEEALELSQRKGNQKKILVDIYTKWCKWCERMDQITFRHPQIAQYINENFYPVKFDAQQSQEIVYQEKSYGNVKSGKKRYHALAVELLRGKMSYPTIVFLDEDSNLIQSVAGFKSPRQFEKIATYFGSDFYRNTPWSKYQKVFKPILTDE
ncbi:MAG: thioredoxin domain-containing protein [Saprospiraceae bacterium]|nr:thioredoxin domain-containing protein [Saprospiraceae bacterium]